LHPNHRLFGQATPGPGPHTTTPAQHPLSPAAADLARRRAAGQGGAPGAKRGRTTLTRGERRPR
jgi:hypothetical protein